jgi:hypothetical protein
VSKKLKKPSSSQVVPHGEPDGANLTAALPKGITESDFRHAVSTSGYPLQINVAATLKQRDFHLQEEFAGHVARSGVTAR